MNPNENYSDPEQSNNIPSLPKETPTIKVGITQGDINGIGIETIIKALSEPDMTDNFIPVIYGSPKAFAFYRKNIDAPNFNLNNIRNADETHPRRINIIDCTSDDIHVEPGLSTPQGGQAAFAALQTAVNDLKNGKIDVLVTAPINKKNIQSDNFHFPGHTEYLQKEAGEMPALMLLVSNNIRVGVVAGHMPMAQVPSYITVDRILDKLRILNSTLKLDFTIRRPRIAVLGLNPHAGDNGLLGSEEEQVIIPAIKAASEEGIYAMGPYAADGVFGSDALGKFDAILAMYHDQGLAPFKALAFESGVNYTAGLPFIRTSPDHGTAYDIAGQGKASADSMRAAIWLALDVFKSRKQNREISANPMVSRAEQVRERNA